MEVTFASSTLSEVARYYSWGDIRILKRLDLESIGRASSLRDLSRECRGYRMLGCINNELLPEADGITDNIEFAASVMNGHISPFAVVL